MNIWWLATSAKDNYCSYEELKQRKVLAQGWPEIGDLTSLIKSKPNKDNLKNTICNFIAQQYPQKTNCTHCARSIVNLLMDIKVGDIVAICEGINVKGFAKVTKSLEYSYDNNYEYAHQVGIVTEWKNWDSSKVGQAPKIPGQGPKGIEHCNNDAQKIIDAWSKL